MNWNIFQWRSLKTRVTLFTLVIFVISIWSLAFYVSRMLREDMERLLGEQQFSTASFMAAEINGELRNRLKALESVAGAIGPALLENAPALQANLEQRMVLQNLFNGGLIAYRLDGNAIAEVPLAAERISVNDMDANTLAAALTEGKTTIGPPIMGKKLLTPVFDMATPIRDAQGKVIGALAGVTNLGKPNFLDKITERGYGRTGAYLLAAPQHKLFVTSSDKSRIMRPLPAPGVNPMHDKYAQGYEGYGLLVNFRGEEELTAAKGIPVAGWFIGIALPTAEAFAPIYDLQRRMLLATIILTLLAGSLTWWMLRRQLSPMLAAARTLATLSSADQPLQPLPITRQDEIGDFIGGFNRLLATIGQRDEARDEALSRLQKISSRVPGVVYQYRLRPDGSSCFPFASEAIRELYRVSPEEVGEDASKVFAILHPDDYDSIGASIQKSAQGLTPWRHEYRVKFDDGTVRWLFGNALPQREADGSTLWHGFITDITERKQAEEQLRIAATAFESQESMVVTDAEGVILRINKAFAETTGYTAEEAVGQTPRLFKSGRHDADFYRVMWETIHRTGGWQGEVWDRRKNGEVYPKRLTISAVKDDDGMVTHYIGAHHDITERKQAEERINELAFFDQLTGLPNRTLLLDRLKQTMAASSRSGSYGALLFIDLDHFKALNDTLGHDMGDLLLKQVAQRLTTCVRAGDTVARLGGDEFVVMLASLSMSEGDAAAQTELVGEKILAALNRSYQLKDVAYHNTPSIGVTLFNDHQLAIDDLLKQADLAMYRSKDAGRNTLHFFDPDMEIVVMKRAALEMDLREAVEDKQFLLHYQPQLADGQLTGAEALVRWQHPQRGLVSPAEFIPLAEDTGLILPLGHWVLETACTQLALWAARPEMADLTVAVNVSAHQVRQADFVEQVLAVLQNTGANPQRLKLELTESLLVANVEQVIAKMFALKARGVGFSLDDFGTGYSSLSYLKRLPLDQLKIDRSFVRDVLVDPNDASIARTIIALAQNLGLGVIAEGVETAEQRDFLAGSGCHAYQGYFFSRPLPLEGFEEFAQRV